MNKLTNSAMMPQPGVYTLEQTDVDTFADILANEPFQSFVGYPDTAALLEHISGAKVPVSREQAALEDGDRMLIVRLKFRVADPATKTKFTPKDTDFEYFVCQYQSC